ncbi:hypothetical protein ABTD98_20275, partial [Acinetobacter baumannii]
MTPVGILMGLIVVVAFAAWIVAMVSFLRAWMAANRSESFRALGINRYVNWMGSVKHMPPEARSLLRPFFKAFGVFFV